MNFPKGSRWFPDGVYMGYTPLKKETDNVIKYVYLLIKTSPEELKKINDWFPDTVEVCDPGSLPIHSWFVRFPRNGEDPGGYL
jgi:hypothetical protein